MAQSTEERAKSVLHFLDMYLDARAAMMAGRASLYTMENARNFLGTALVALVTDAPEPKPAVPEREYVAGPYASQRKVDE